MLVYDIAVEAYSPQRVMRQFGLYQEVLVPLGETVPPKIHLYVIFKCIPFNLHVSELYYLPQHLMMSFLQAKEEGRC